MNKPPETFIRVPHRELQAFVSRAAQTVGLAEDKPVSRLGSQAFVYAQSGQ